MTSIFLCAPSLRKNSVPKLKSKTSTEGGETSSEESNILSDLVPQLMGALNNIKDIDKSILVDLKDVKIDKDVLVSWK